MSSAMNVSTKFNSNSKASICFASVRFGITALLLDWDFGNRMVAGCCKAPERGKGRMVFRRALDISIPSGQRPDSQFRAPDNRLATHSHS